jgi:hypothetical protein
VEVCQFGDETWPGPRSVKRFASAALTCVCVMFARSSVPLLSAVADATVGSPEPPPSVIVIGTFAATPSLRALKPACVLTSAVWSIRVVPSFWRSWMTRVPDPPTGPLMTLILNWLK